MENLGKPKGIPANKTKNQPPPEDMKVDQERPNNAKQGEAEEVDQERPKVVEGVQGVEKVVRSTNSYKSLDFTDEETLQILPYRKKDIRELIRGDRKSTLGTQLNWIHKYLIGEKVKLYYGVDLKKDPWFTDTVMLYQDFPKVGLRLALSPLAVSFFNYTQRAL